MRLNLIQTQLQLQILGITSAAADIAEINSSIESLQDPGVAALTSATSVALNFDPLVAPIKLLTATHDITFTTSNLQAGRGLILKITASGGDRTLAFPAWVFVGEEPTLLASGKTAVLSLISTAASDSAVIAAFSAEA